MGSKTFITSGSDFQQQADSQQDAHFEQGRRANQMSTVKIAAIGSPGRADSLSQEFRNRLVCAGIPSKTKFERGSGASRSFVIQYGMTSNFDLNKNDGNDILDKPPHRG
jgi:hypothetical protein